MNELLFKSVEERSKVLHSEKGEKLLQAIHQASDAKKFDAIKELVAFYFDHNAPIDAVTILIRNVQDINNYTWVWNTLAKLQLFKTNVDYAQRYFQFIAHYIEDEQILNQLTESLFSSPVRSFHHPKRIQEFVVEVYKEKQFSTETLQNLYLKSLADQDLWGTYFDLIDEQNTPDWHSHALEKWEQWKSGNSKNPEQNLQIVNRLIEVQQVDRAFEFTKAMLYVMDPSSPYYNIFESIEYYITTKADQSATIGHSLWPTAWEITVQRLFEHGRFKEAYYAIKSYRILAGNEEAFTEYDEIIQLGFKKNNLPKGNSNYAKAFRASEIYQDHEQAIAYFKLALPEENKESVIKNLVKIYYQVERKQEIIDLLLENEAEIKDTKWVFFHLSTIYKTLNQHDKRINLAKNMYKNWKLTNRFTSILEEYTVVMTDYYHLGNAFDAFQQMLLHSGEVTKKNNLFTFLRASLYARELNEHYSQLDRLTEVVKQKVTEEDWDKVNERVSNYEENRMEYFEAILNDLKEFSEQSLHHPAIHLIKRLNLREIPDHYKPIIDQLTTYFTAGLENQVEETEEMVQEENSIKEAIEQFTEKASAHVIQNNMNALYALTENLYELHKGEPEIEKVYRRIKHLKNVPFKPQERQFSIANRLMIGLGEVPKAIPYLEGALNSEPKKERTMKVLITAYNGERQYEKLLHMLKTNGNYIEDKDWLDQAFVDVYIDLEKYDEALMMLKMRIGKAVKEEDVTKLLIQMANISILAKHYDDALQHAHKILAKDEYNEEGLLLKIRVLTELGRLLDAEENLKQMELRYSTSKRMEQLKTNIAKKREEFIHLEKTICKEFTEAARTFNSKKITQLIRNYEENLSITKEEMQISRSPGQLTDKQQMFFKEKRYDEALTFFLKMLVLNPNFSLLYTQIGRIYEEQEMFDEARTFYYISARMADKKKNWTIFVTFCHRHALNVERVLGFIHLYGLDPADQHTHKELDINIRKVAFKKSIQSKSKAVLDEIVEIYNDKLESFHMQSDQKEAQLVIGFVQYVKKQYQEAILLLEEHLDYYERIQMAYHLLSKEETEISNTQFQKLLSEDYQNFAKSGLELVEIVKNEGLPTDLFFTLTEYLPLTPSMDRIADYVEECINKGQEQNGLVYMQWLQRSFQNDLPIRRGLSRLQVSAGYLEDGYQSMFQTMRLGKHPNDFLHDIPDLIFFCYENNMEFRVPNIVEYSQSLKQEVIVENTNDTRINTLKEDVIVLRDNLEALNELVSEDASLLPAYQEFIRMLKNRHFTQALAFTFNPDNLLFLQYSLVWETMYAFLYKNRFLSSLVREWFVIGYDEKDSAQELLAYIHNWKTEIYQLIETTRAFIVEGAISEEENITLFDSLIDISKYNAILLESFDEFGSPKTELTIKIGEIIFGERMVSKAMSFYLSSKGETLPIEIELELIQYCHRIQPNDYYLLRMGNIYFNEEKYDKALDNFKQLDLNNSKYRHHNLKMILASELFDRIEQPEKYVGTAIDLSTYTFFELTSFVTYILRNNHIQHRSDELFTFLQDENETLLTKLFEFNYCRIEQDWWKAYEIVKEFASQPKEFYQSFLTYFIKKLVKHAAPEELRVIVESEKTRIDWSKKESLVPPKPSVVEERDENPIVVEESLDIEEEEIQTEHKLNVEADYLEEFKDPQESIPEQTEESEEKAQETSTVTTVAERTKVEENPTSIAEFSHHIPQIWRDFTRYQLDDRRAWNRNLIELLKSEVELAPTDEIRAQTWLKIAKLAHELGFEQEVLGALFQYGIHEMKNAFNLDIRFVRYYAYETLFIEKFRKQERVTDENLVKSVISILLDGISHIKKIEEILAEAQNLRWITDNVDLGPSRLGLQAGMSRLNSIIRSLEKFIESNEIDEKVVLYNSIVVKNNDLAKGSFRDNSIRRSFENISKHWRRVIKTLNDSLYPRPKLVVKVLNNTCKTNGELFLEISNIGEGMAENVQVSLQEFGEGTELGKKDHMIEMIRPKKAKALSLALQFDREGEAELTFTTSFVDVQGKASQFQENFIVKIQNEEKPFEDIPDRYQPSVVKKTEDFYGREDILDRIHKNVSGGDYDKVIVIHGLRRVGKTSILYYLNETMHDRLIPVFIDMQGLEDVSSTAELLYFQFVETIHDTFRKREGVKLEMPDFDEFQIAPTKRFNRYLTNLDEHLNGRKLLFMIDEFEGLINAVNDNRVDKSIFSAFRNMMQHRNDCRFIIVGADKVVDMITDYASAIFNISLNISVSFLEPSAARKMITEMTPEVRFTETSIDRLLELTNGHPYYTKILCANIIKHLNRQKRTTVYLNDVDKATNDVVTMTHGDYFKFLWDMFDPIEKLIVSYIAEKLKYPEERITLEKIIQYFESNRDMESGDILIALASLVNRNILIETSIFTNDRSSNQYYFALDLYRESFKYNKPLVKTKIEVKEYVNF